MSLKLTTTKSLYKPITIEIDGVVLTAEPVTRETLATMTEQEKRIRAGDADAAYEQIEMIFGKHEVIDKLELRQVNEIIQYLTKQLFNPERMEEGAEKNVSRPGGKKSAK